MSTVKQINIPDLGDVDEVEVIEVCVEVGQKVESEDSIMILETDKAAMEIPASLDGKVKNILINVGDMVKQGMPFVEILVSETSTEEKDTFEDDSIPVVASTDYMRAYAEQIRPYVKADYTVLGTDGFGRSDSRKNLREFFEIDATSITRAAAYTLHKNNLLNKTKLKQIYDDLEVDPLKPNPWEV